MMTVVGKILVFFFWTFFVASPASAFQSFEEFNQSRENPVNIGVEAIPEPARVDSGERFTLIVRVHLNEGWHIYSMRLQGKDKSLSTRIRMEKNFFLPMEAWKETSPEIMLDEALDKVVNIHKTGAEFSLEYEVPPALKQGKYPLGGTLVYRACDNRACALPDSLEFQTYVWVKRGP